MRGHSLVELLLVLTLIGTTTASLAPTARGYLDRAGVVAAREALVGLLAETRLAAIENGEARLCVTTTPSTAEGTVGGSPIRAVDFGNAYDVYVELTGHRTEVELAFGPLGLGRPAGQTIRFLRGDSSAELVISAYGRVTRR